MSKKINFKKNIGTTKSGYFKKIIYLLSYSQKKSLLILSFLILIGVFFEMFGLGVLMPSLALLSDSKLQSSNQIFKSINELLGYPSKNLLALLGLSIIILVYFFKSIFLIFLSWKQSKFTTDLSANLSYRLFSGYMNMPLMFHIERNSSQLLRNIQGEVAQFNALTQALSLLSIELCVIIGITLVLLIIEPFGAILVLSLLFFATLIFYRLTKRKILKWGKNRQLLDGIINSDLIHGLSGIREIKIYGRENFFLTFFEKNNQERALLTAKQLTLNIAPRYFLEFLAVLGMGALVLAMKFQEKSFEIILPTVGAFIAAAFRIIPSANRIIASIQQFKYGQPVIDLFYAEFKLLETINQKKSLDDPMIFNKSILIDTISFSYNNNRNGKTIRDLSFIINKGEFIGIIGTSGSGKSTLIDLILGLLEPESGVILVDGVDIKTNMKEWQNIIGYVPQTIYLIDDTLKNNIAFGVKPSDICEKKLLDAIKTSQLDQFINTLPQGLDTMVGERGVMISGGQRQRIAIARALYKNPSIIILDEATSALDEITENGVIEALNLLQGLKTVIMVTHKPSILLKCDKIFKIENGVLVSSINTSY